MSCYESHSALISNKCSLPDIGTRKQGCDNYTGLRAEGAYVSSTVQKKDKLQTSKLVKHVIVRSKGIHPP